MALFAQVSRETNVVLILDELDDVGGVVREDAAAGTFNVLAQLVVDMELLLGDGEDQVD